MADNESSDATFRYEDGVLVIEPPNELFDRLEIASVGDEWIAIIESECPRRVVINFDKVKFFGSEAIGVVIRVTKRVRGYGGDVRLCSMGKVIREIFDICQLIPALFQIYDSTADAITSFDE